jgi:hypothetical protein
MANIKKWLPAVIGSFVLATLLFVALYILPKQNSDISVRTKPVQTLYASLDSTYNALSSLSSPDDIQAQNMDSAGEYIQSLVTASPKIINEELTAPKPINGFALNERAKNYNQLVKDPEFLQSFDVAHDALRNSREFLDHHAGVLRTLRNIIEYQPESDTANKEPKALLAAVELAGGGIERARIQLKDINTYDDPAVADINALLETFQSAQADYLGVLEAGTDASVQRSAYISACLNAQKSILSSRIVFWEENISDILSSLESAKRQLMPYYQKLTNI